MKKNMGCGKQKRGKIFKNRWGNSTFEFEYKEKIWRLGEKIRISSSII